MKPHEHLWTIPPRERDRPWLATCACGAGMVLDTGLDVPPLSEAELARLEALERRWRESLAPEAESETEKSPRNGPR